MDVPFLPVGTVTYPNGLSSPPALGPLFMEANMGRGILLWLLGVPIPIIILLWLFFGR
ncbi:hypothetical protein [Bradyrhizobium sp. URHD0069]|uniref:hypothetical protein n=1 Tax=Bradyrhizobium sp. URHD0069 TaxID=1380355 RepID=UPI000AB2778F|nr:hypothetical protein [Bradyrhizobium sp. URHD0069]